MTHIRVPGRKLLVRIVTIADKGALEPGQKAIDHLVGSGRREVEHHLVMITVKGPEVARGHLPLARRLVLLPADFDRRLVHGQHSARKNGPELGFVYRNQQIACPVHPVGQCSAADMHA